MRLLKGPKNTSYFFVIAIQLIAVLNEIWQPLLVLIDFQALIFTILKVRTFKAVWFKKRKLQIRKKERYLLIESNLQRYQLKTKSFYMKNYKCGVWRIKRVNAGCIFGTRACNGKPIINLSWPKHLPWISVNQNNSYEITMNC